MTNNIDDLRETVLATAMGTVTGSAFMITAEMVHGWASTGSALIGFLILCVTLTHASVKLARYIKKDNS